MIAEAMQKVFDLSILANKEVVIDGRTYAPGYLTEIKPSKSPVTEAICLCTLSGLVASYVEADKNPDLSYLVHVTSESRVEIISDVFGPNRQRETYAVASPILDGFVFGRYTDLETFIIALQSQFVQDQTTAAILKLVGNIKDEKVKTTADDGVSQQVTARVGISRVENVPVPNPVSLAPFRTFPNIDQPVSRFVLRLQSGAGSGTEPKVALFEADGGAWRNEAMANIQEFLNEALPVGARLLC